CEGGTSANCAPCSTVRLCPPIVMLAVRRVLSGLGKTSSSTLPAPLPALGLTMTKGALLEAVQSQVPARLSLTLAPSAVTLCAVVGLSIRWQVPACVTVKL